MKWAEVIAAHAVPEEPYMITTICLSLDKRWILFFQKSSMNKDKKYDAHGVLVAFGKGRKD